MSRPLPTGCFDFNGGQPVMASSAVGRSWETTRADISMTTFADTHCISIEYTDYSLQRPLALNFQFSPNFSITIGSQAPGNAPALSLFGGVL